MVPAEWPLKEGPAGVAGGAEESAKNEGTGIAGWLLLPSGRWLRCSSSGGTWTERLR